MRKLLFLLTLLCIEKALHAQQPYIYTIKADSVKITNSCDTAELIIENHTQNVPGFLFNKGRGRTEFRRVLQKNSDTLYFVGPDSLKIPNAWVQGGNTWGSTGVLGTKDNNHVDFYTDNAQRMRLTNTGNLLLDTLADSDYKLNVNGKLKAGINTLIGANNISEITNSDTALKVLGNFEVVTANILGVNGGFKVVTEPVLFQRPGATTMFLNNVPMTAYDGKVFFGGPMSPYLAVREWGNSTSKGGGPFSRTKYTLGTDSDPEGWNDSYALFGTSDGSEFTGSSGYPSRVNYYILETRLNAPIVSANTGQLAVRAPLKIGARQLWFYAGEHDPGAEVMRMTEVGNVLIGSTTDNGNKLQVTGSSYFNGGVQVNGLTNDNSQTRVLVSDANGNVFYRDASSLSAINDVIPSDLAVNGTVTAQKMRITQTGAWPDYVFSKQYHLPSLQELERFIKQNNHLPGIPSATEVEKNGIDVANNQAALLRKIEELTLYVIKQNEEITELKKQNKQLEDLKTQMAELRTLMMNKK